MVQIYFASPFFNPEQVEREEALKELLRFKGMNIYSPKEQCFLPANSTTTDREKVFNDNCKAIEDCDFVFAITDGKDVGTIWECGYAYAKGKRVIYFCETLGSGLFNLMLAASGIAIFKSREDVINNLLVDKSNLGDGLWIAPENSVYQGLIE